MRFLFDTKKQSQKQQKSSQREHVCTPRRHHSSVSCPLCRVLILNHPEAHKNIILWKNNMKRLNKRSSLTDNSPKLTIESDASDTGIGGILCINERFMSQIFYDERK